MGEYLLNNRWFKKCRRGVLPEEDFLNWEDFLNSDKNWFMKTRPLIGVNIFKFWGGFFKFGGYFLKIGGLKNADDI